MLVKKSGRWRGNGAPPAMWAGVFTTAGSDGPSKAADFMSEAGADLKVVQTFQVSDGATWDDIECNPNGGTPHWVLQPWLPGARPAGTRLELAVSMKPDDSWSTSVGEGAAGAYNSHWVTLAQNLVDAGMHETLLRVGREFNIVKSGVEYPWRASFAVREDWVNYWRHIVTSMRSVHPGFEFVWCPNWGKNSTPAELCYPGDDYVDYVGVDVYDYNSTELPGMGTVYPAPNPTDYDDPETLERQAIAADLNIHGPYGLDHWSGFARGHGKKFCIPEWGLWEHSSGHHGRDNAVFVEKMAEYILTPDNGVEYHCYFNHTGTAGAHHLNEHTNVTESSPFPRAWDQYKASFGGA